MNPLETDICQRLELVVLQIDDLLGDDLIDRRILHDRLTARARQYAGQLTAGNPREAAQTAIDLASLVDLDDPADAASSLGIACTLTFDHGEIAATHAAKLLGISRNRLYQLIESGKIDRGPAGGISRASIARRLSIEDPGIRH